MEKIIPFVTLMFMLSVINERIGEFLKNYLSGRRLWCLKWLIVGDTTTKYPDGSPQELRRHYRILKLNLVIGFITAFLCHASLFSILHNMANPGTVIGWPEKIILPDPKTHFLKYLSFPLGCLLTGAFISLGSKFWHDMLDILLEIKGTRRVLNASTGTDQGAGSAMAFTQLADELQVSQIEAAISINGEKWINTIPNVTGVGIGDKITEGQILPQRVIRFEVSNKENLQNISERIPPFIQHGPYLIPTDVIQSDHFELQYAHPGDALQTARCGASVSRGSNPATGTISLKVKRIENGVSKYYMLASGHVMMQKELRQGITQINQGDTITDAMVISPGLDTGQTGAQLGKLTEGRITNHTDSALIALSSPGALSENSFDIGDTGNITKAIDQKDVNKTRVKFSGAFSGLRTGILVRGFGLSKQGNYPQQVGTIVLQQLISIDRCSEEGDSGAVVVTEQNEVIGIIVGASAAFTYVIPIQSVKSAHKQFIII